MWCSTALIIYILAEHYQIFFTLRLFLIFFLFLGATSKITYLPLPFFYLKLSNFCIVLMKSFLYLKFQAAWF